MLDARLLEVETKLGEMELGRRAMLNTILELKGNIRVFCRVRPPTPLESSGALRCLTDRTLELVQTAETGVTGTEKLVERVYPFTFDKVSQFLTLRCYSVFMQVFSESDCQESVFTEIKQLLQSVVDGYNVCIFAYGTTGSGKTYTYIMFNC